MEIESKDKRNKQMEQTQSKIKIRNYTSICMYVYLCMLISINLICLENEIVEMFIRAPEIRNITMV